ncbi:hypothetical protein NPIL_199001 [Nephila pilipes]|uniref:Uncharacterized protein n=1 Tax=Nephila pilipes TaxID=299642 RepID=A0A8X6TK60_NEPPI|nr:hypothetical protein NPIL_199001 [Nephila pilipes]
MKKFLFPTLNLLPDPQTPLPETENHSFKAEWLQTRMWHLLQITADVCKRTYISYSLTPSTAPTYSNHEPKEEGGGVGVGRKRWMAGVVGNVPVGWGVEGKGAAWGMNVIGGREGWGGRVEREVSRI